jgi:hypothetical protein
MRPEGNDHALALDLLGPIHDHTDKFLVTKVYAVKIAKGYDAVGKRLGYFAEISYEQHMSWRMSKDFSELMYNYNVFRYSLAE